MAPLADFDPPRRRRRLTPSRRRFGPAGPAAPGRAGPARGANPKKRERAWPVRDWPGLYLFSLSVCLIA